MEKYSNYILIFFVLSLLFCGCVSKPPDSGNTLNASSYNLSDNHSAKQEEMNGNRSNQLNASEQLIQDLKPDISHAVPSIYPTETSKRPSMDDFIISSFPEVTDQYVSIKESQNALALKEVQKKALELQLLIQDYKKKYRLDIPNSEKKAFGTLDSRREIIFLKYLQYLNDMEEYAVNLKNAVYYQEKGGDSESIQNVRRYQSHADQYLKEAIAEVKTINDYCNDFKYTFFDPILVQKYRYTRISV